MDNLTCLIHESTKVELTCTRNHEPGNKRLAHNHIIKYGPFGPFIRVHYHIGKKYSIKFQVQMSNMNVIQNSYR